MGRHEPGNSTTLQRPPKTLPDRLQEVYVKQVEISECEKIFRQVNNITHDIGINQICAVDPTLNRGAFLTNSSEKVYVTRNINHFITSYTPTPLKLKLDQIKINLKKRPQVLTTDFFYLECFFTHIQKIFFVITVCEVCLNLIYLAYLKI